MKKGSVVSHLPDFLIAYSYSLAPLIILSQTSTSSFLSVHGNPFQDSISSSSVYGLLGYILSIKIRVRNLRTYLLSPCSNEAPLTSGARRAVMVLTDFQASQLLTELGRLIEDDFVKAGGLASLSREMISRAQASIVVRIGTDNVFCTWAPA